MSAEGQAERRAYGTRVLMRRLRRWGWVFASGFALVVWQISAGDGLNQAYSLMIFALMCLAAYLVATSYTAHSGDEADWAAAVWAHRWADALALAGRLPLGEGEQALLRARALAGLGRWDEAQAVMKATKPEMLPQGRYWELLADVFDTRGDRAAQRRALERAVHEHPRPIRIMQTLAEMALVDDRDPAACKAWLDRIFDREKPDPNSAAMLTLRGGMAFEAEDDDAAIELLERGIDVLEQEKLRTPQSERWSGAMQAYLAMARARRGDIGEARILSTTAAAALARFGPSALEPRLRQSLSGRG